jgi:hypothetical protein
MAAMPTTNSALRSPKSARGRWKSSSVRHRKGLQAAARRWVVERTIAWLNRNRRLAKDFERTIGTLAWLFLGSGQPNHPQNRETSRNQAAIMSQPGKLSTNPCIEGFAEPATPIYYRMSINLLLNQRRKESHTLAVDDAGILSIPDEARDPEHVALVFDELDRVARPFKQPAVAMASDLLGTMARRNDSLSKSLRPLGSTSERFRRS